MRLKKVRLFNGYKRFHDTTIDLGENPARLIALVGPNGCGKSSVLDGILFHSNAYGQIGNKRGKDYTYHSMTGDRSLDYQSVKLDFDNGDYIQNRNARAGKENTIFSFRSPYRYNSQLDVKETKAVSDIVLNNYGATAASDLDDKMEESYRRLNIKFNKYMNENDCRPSEAKEKIIEDLNKSLTNCLDIEIDNIGNIESSQGTLYFRKTGQPATFSFNVLSSGEKEVVDILLDLYLRQDDFNDTVFLLDEPELHINTSIQKNLLIEIDKLIGKNCQIWITTHSIGFMRALQENFREDCQIIYFDPNNNYSTEPVTLKPSEKTLTIWRKIFSIALDDLTHLLSPKRIVYCEGRDSPGSGGRERGMDAQAFNSIFNEKHPDTLFISSGGNTELDQRSEIAIAILSKALPSVEVLVLKDRDSGSGKPISQHDRDRYLDNNPDNHRMLKRWEIENYLFSKEALKAYCNSQGTTFDEAAYDNLATDIENQSIKDEVSRIRNICGLSTSINADKLKLNIAKVFPSESAPYKELEACIFS